MEFSKLEINLGKAFKILWIGKKLGKACGILCFSGNKLRRPSWKSLFLGYGNRTTIELISVSVFLKNPTSPHHWSIYFSNSAGGQSSLTSNSLSSQSTGSSSPGSTSVSFSSSFSLSFLSMLSLGFGTSSVIELPIFVSLSVVIFPIDSSQDSPFIVSPAGYFLCCWGFSAEILGVEF